MGLQREKQILLLLPQVQKKYKGTSKGKEEEKMKGRHLSEEHRKKLGDANRGEKHYFYGQHLSTEHKTKISISCKGRKLSDETKEKMSIAHKGKINAEEHNIKIGNARRGKHHTEEGKKRMSAWKGENGHFYGKHHSEEAKNAMRNAKIDWVFVKEFGTTRSIYPYSMFFDEKHKKMIQELYDYRCVITGMTQEEHIAKYGTKLTIHHWNHDKDSEDPFFMIPVACNINCSCPSNGENKHEWISLFNTIVEDKWCEMLKKGNLGDFYKQFGYDINNCCYIYNNK